MRSKHIAEDPKTFVIVLDTGDELLSSLKSFAKAERLSASSFKAIGALSSVELGWFNWETKKYETAVKLQEQVELLSLIGDIALKDNEPQVHAHLVIGRRDGTAHGGHRLSAIVRPTCEIVITESPQHLHKEFDPEFGQIANGAEVCRAKVARPIRGPITVALRDSERSASHPLRLVSISYATRSWPRSAEISTTS